MRNRKDVPPALILAAAMTARPGAAIAMGGFDMRSLPAEVAAQTEFTAGRYGKAIRLKDGKGLCYPCHGKTFPVEEGTFSCWLRDPKAICRILFKTANENYMLRVWPLGKPEKGKRAATVPYAKVQKQNGFCHSPAMAEGWYQWTMTWILNKDDPNGKGRLHIYVNGLGGRGRYQYKWQAPFDYQLDPSAWFELGLLPCEMDDVVILDEFLSPEEVRKMYFSGPHEPGPHTRIYIHFDEGKADGLVRKEAVK